MPPGILLIHGFTASPPIMNYLKGRFEEADYLTLNPVLAGHEENWKSLSESRWPDWYASVRKAFLELKSKASPVFIAGHSLGGLLALKLALEFPNDVKKLSCLASPFYMESFLGRYIAPIIWNSPLKEIYPDHRKAFDSLFHDKSAMKDYRKWNYHKMPIKAVRSLNDLQKSLRADVDQLELPILFIYSKRDQIVLDRSRAFMREKFKNSKIIKLEKSGHIIPMDSEKNLVGDELIQFFRS